MALSSPGVQVTVIDESFYTPAAPGTVPLIVVASAQDKLNSSGTGIAPGTTAANAGRVYLVTSQRDLAETFGDPTFYTDSNNNPIHAGELNEYGLQAAYSLLGVSNRAFVVRAGVNLSELQASAEAPANTPDNGTYWFDTAATTYGIFEWNNNPVTSPGGQTFVNKTPIVITDESKVTPQGFPKGSVGSVGSYAVVATNTANNYFYKNRTGQWVLVGSNEWSSSWPTVTGSIANATLTPGSTMRINGALVTASGSSLTSLAATITGAGLPGVSAAVVNSKLEIYSDGTLDAVGDDSTTVNAIVIAEGSGLAAAAGLTPGSYYVPRLQISKHTQIPDFKRNSVALIGGNGRASGSLWVKTTQPNNGAKFRVKRYNSNTGLFEQIEAPIYDNNHSAIYNLDQGGGGFNIDEGTLYIQSNFNEDFGLDDSPKVANFKIFRKNAAAETPTTIRTSAITAANFTNGAKTFYMAESVAGQAGLSAKYTITFLATGSINDATLMAEAINAAGMTHVTAEVDSQNRVIISHARGGEIRIDDRSQGVLSAAGMSAYVDANTGTANLYAIPSGEVNNYSYVATLWKALSYEANDNTPTALTADGRLWYNSIIDEIDIMVHDGDNWVGYQSPTSPYYTAVDNDKTDPNGPIVGATKPETQSDGSALKTGDLWIDTSDIENFPMIYRYENAGTTAAYWRLIDNSDQSTEDGILFADARYNTAGSNSDEPGNIVEMLSSDFLDFDAPDPALYPRGMMLWNLRRSGFNVKKFVRNYVDINDENIRGSDRGVRMDSYYPHRWVTESGNQENGAGTFGRKAQRKVVVQSLQALVNSNADIRDDEARIFNLLACPGYPELIGELVSLNYDRGLTAFVVGDSPARLRPDATSLLEWGSNVNLAVEDNDNGLVSFDEYLGVFYPWGFTSDNFGNNVVVPPSHMILRTIALSDQVSYPWFAPAGTRRGGITNATAVGYIDDEGEFVSIALNEGQRDTMAGIKVNPITFITGAGLVNYGQFTRARNASALDRINVARLVIYLRRQLSILAKPYIFEPNDKITRDEIKGAVESLLLELVGQRALYDYLVVCDESNNTPSRIDRNELYVDVAIEPVKAVEFIYIPLRLKNTGEIAGLA